MSAVDRARTADPHRHRAPSACPVCGDRLAVTRLGCGTCGTELAGLFAPCDYCALDDKESEMLRVFLASRGNLREVEKHLGVSYPTARARFNDLLRKLGLAAVEDRLAQASLARSSVHAAVLTDALALESLLGEAGLRALAATNHAGAVAAAERLARVPGVTLVNDTFFNEFTLRLPKPPAPLRSARVQPGMPARSRAPPKRCASIQPSSRARPTVLVIQPRSKTGAQRYCHSVP